MADPVRKPSCAAIPDETGLEPECPSLLKSGDIVSQRRYPLFVEVLSFVTHEANP